MNALRAIPILYMRNLTQFPRIPSVLVFGILVPVIQLLLFGSTFQRVTDIPGNPYADVNYFAYIAPAIMMLTTVFGMANVSAALTGDLKNGYFDKLRTTPARPWAILAARVLADFTRVALQATLVLLVALALGATVATGVPGAILIILLASSFSALTVGLFVLAIALKTKSDEATQSIFPLFFVLVFLSTAYMPKQLMPGWLGTAVSYNPVDYLINALRGLMLDGWVWADVGIAAASAVGIGLVMAALNVRIYRTMVD